jgi:hypothetical protein
VWSVRVAADRLPSVPERARCSPRHTSTVPSVCVEGGMCQEYKLSVSTSSMFPRRLM